MEKVSAQYSVVMMPAKVVYAKETAKMRFLQTGQHPERLESFFNPKYAMATEKAKHVKPKKMPVATRAGGAESGVSG